MKLTPAEVNTPLWQRLSEHYTPLLASYRERLENPGIAESERIKLAWQIDGIKQFLAMAEPAPEPKRFTKGVMSGA